jgi:UDP:flavonoid glycosyltransferase YjiC (YdhE family)
LRIVLATVGSLGDLHPYIAIARALKERGARPVVASVPDYRADVEREGIEFAPVGPSFAVFGDYGKLLEKIFDPRRGVEFIWREMAMPYLAQSHAELLQATQGADLLVSHPLTVAMPLVAETRALPWVATILSPLSLMSADDPPLIPNAAWLRSLRRLGRAPYAAVFGLFRLVGWRWEAPLRAFRRELGLPRKPGLAMLESQFSPSLNLALFDPQLARPQRDWPRNLRVTGAPMYDGPVSGMDELKTFLEAGEAPLVFALGSSAVWVAGDFWRHAIDASRSVGRRALFITGPAPLGPLPEGMRALSYVPYSRIFPRSLAVIHQGGIGTLSQALRSGRPQLIVPFAFDQPDNARRAAALGVGRVLPAGKVNSRSMEGELRALLADGAYDRRAQVVARELRETNGAVRAAEALLEMAPC